MVLRRESARVRRQEARHRWDALFSDSATAQPAEPLLDLSGGAEEHAEEGGARPSRRTAVRFSLSLRLGAVVAGVLALCLTGWWMTVGSARPEVRSVEAASEQPDSAAPSPSAAAAGPTVHVAGAVAAPGVYHLPPGARVYEAIAAAGGAAVGADVARLNLAARIEDGTQLRVPSEGEAEDHGAAAESPAARGGGGASGGGGPASGRGGGSAPRVNINTAAVEELSTLPRVGPVLAQRIVDYRTAHGRFAAPEDLDAVGGIGAKMLESLVPLVTVG